MSFLRQVVAIAAKDLLLEWRSPARLSAVFFFSVALVLLVGFASGGTGLRKHAAGTLWMALMLASTRSLDRSFSVETEQGALEGLVLWPVDPVAVYYGKAIANTILLLTVSAALTPVMIILYEAPIRGSLAELATVLMLGAAGLAAPGTLLAVITSQARSASVLLPVLMFPLVLPTMLAASRGTASVIDGDPMGDLKFSLFILAICNAVHWSVSGLLFARVLEDA